MDTTPCDCEKRQCCSCASAPTNPSLIQHLDEMDFERGIWQAAIDNNTSRIQDLVTNKGIHPDSPDNFGYTGLHYAARNGKIEATKMLIRLGANVNCTTRNNKSTPLHRAAMSGHVAIIKILKEAGADLTLLDADDLTPLLRAMKEGKSESVEILRQ